MVEWNGDSRMGRLSNRMGWSLKWNGTGVDRMGQGLTKIGMDS